MPPKKPKKTAKDVKLPDKAVPPAATRDPKAKNKEQTKDKGTKVKNVIEVFDSQLYQRHTEHEREVRKTLGQIHYLKKDNERLQRKQTAEFGMTIDMIIELRQALAVTRDSNLKLFHEMEETKGQYDKLDLELKTVKAKYKETVKVVEDYKKETKKWNNTAFTFLKTEARSKELLKTNKRLRVLLLKHHIDPNTDVREFDREAMEERLSVKSNKSFPRHNIKQMTVKSRYGSTDDLATLRSDGCVESKYRQEDIRILEQISPAYWGWYKKRKDFVPEKRFYRDGVRLPKI